MSKNIKSENVKSEKSELSQSDLIWNEIKDLELGLFSLPNQMVAKYCTPLPLDPNRLFLDFKNLGAVLPALDDLISKKFNVELVDKYIVVSRK